MKDACVNFRLGRDGFCVELSHVRAIATAGSIATVPLAPPVVKGLASFRGRVVTLIDVALLFDRTLSEVRRPEDRIALLLAAPFEHLGLYVHAPVEIARVEPGPRSAAARGGAQAQVAAATSGDTGAASGMHRGVPAPDVELLAMSGEIVHLLSPQEIVSRCAASVLERFRRNA